MAESTATMDGQRGRFDPNPNVTWYRTRIDPDTLSELMARSDRRGWIQTLLHLGLFFATAVLAYFTYLQISIANWYWSVPLLLAVLFIHGTIGPFMGLIAIHELQHRTVFKTRWLNDLFERLYAFISWSDYIWYQESHAIHHRATCHQEYDGEVLLPIRFSLRRWRVWLGLLAWNPKTTWNRIKLVWRHANGRISGEWYQHVLPASNKRLRTRHRNFARILLIGHTLLAVAFIATGHWFLIVVFTFGTFYCGWLGFLCGLPQHYGLNSDIPDFRANTRTFTCSWLPAFYYWNSSSPSNITPFRLFRLRTPRQDLFSFGHRGLGLSFRPATFRWHRFSAYIDAINMISGGTVSPQRFQEAAVRPGYIA